jgi:cytosine/adenosine deaminase-related metal-dependent hydrolase
MISTMLALAAAPLVPVSGPAVGDLLAVRVGRAETISDGPLENAVILIENGVISVVGEDLLVERGIAVLDRPDWVALPGLVNCYSRLGLSGRGGADSTPHVTPEKELYVHSRMFEDLAETGVTTLALYPPGTGIPGQAIVVHPTDDEPQGIDDVLVSRDAYLKIYFRASSRSKKHIRDGFEKVDEYLEKEAKAREKYDKEKEKAEKAKKKKDDKDDEDEKDEEKKDDDARLAMAEDDEEELGPYVPPEPDPEVVPFMQLRDGELRALIGISGAADYLHLLDAIGDEEFDWDLRIPVTRELDIYEIAERLGERGLRVVMEPELSLHPGTLRQRNLPAELARAGAALVLIPRSDSLESFESWLRDTGLAVGAGLDRDVALRAMTLEPAGLLGLDERLGSIEAGKDANLIFTTGDPLEPSSRVVAVMYEGRMIHEVSQ